MAKTYIIASVIVLAIALVAVYFFLPKDNFGLGVDKLPALTGSTAGGLCVDSDKQDSFVKGVTISLADKKSHTDYCVNSDSVMEGYCDGDNLAKKQINCDNNCADGACGK